VGNGTSGGNTSLANRIDTEEVSMTGLTTTANLVDQATLDEESRLTATLERTDVEALLAEGRRQIWFELAAEGQADPYRLTVDLTEDDLQALLAGSSDDAILLALDGEELTGMLEEPDVEAHGLRSALAVSIAVATTAIAAPAGLAATSPATSPAATQQSVGAATTQQGVGAAATTQVVRQIVSQQLRPGTKAQRASALKFKSLTILRAGAVR
jgi:hypothetical protein